MVSDSIPFEKVSVEDAKAKIRQDNIDSPPAPQKNWSPHRDSADAEKVKITQVEMKWLTSLPPDVRPRALAVQYPRIFNKLAALWPFPLACEQYLSGLLLDERGTRKGFPPDVAMELSALQLHFNATAQTRHFGIWGDRIGE